MKNGIIAGVCVLGLSAACQAQLSVTQSVTGSFASKGIANGTTYNLNTSSATLGSGAYEGYNIVSGALNHVTSENDSLITGTIDNGFSFNPLAYGSASVDGSGGLHAGSAAVAMGTGSYSQNYASVLSVASATGQGSLTSSNGSSSVTTPFNLNLDGLLTAFPGGEGSSYISAFVTISQNGSQLFYDELSVSNTGNIIDNGGGFSDYLANNSGLTYGDNLGVNMGNLQTNPITLATGAFTMTLSMNAGASGGEPFLDYGGGDSDFLNTFSLSTSVPVLDLPSGWNFNSSDFHVVNDVYQPTPEPSEWVAIGLGVGMLGLFRRRKSI